MAEGGQDLKFDFEFMKILLETGIDNCWPHYTNLVVDIPDGEVTWKKIYQTSGSHTERQMLDDKEFKDEVEQGKADKTKKTEETKKTDKTEKVNIILTSNYSPCRECADKLKDFYEGKESLIKFTIRFSCLYRIYEKTNKDGLRQLNNAGITLEAMTEGSWFDVLTTEKSWLDSMSTDQKSSFEKMMNEKDWFDKVLMKLFGLDPNTVKKRDATTSKYLTDL